MNVEDTLTEAGAAWRARQPAPPEPDPRRFATTRPRRRWVPVAALTGVAAVITAVVIPVLALRPEGSPPAAGRSVTPDASFAFPPAWLLPADTGAGVRVVGVGTLLREGPGRPVRLCAEVMATLDLPGSSAGCGAVSVATTGVDEATLGHTTTSGQAYGDRVRVEGTYHDGTLAVTAQAPAEPPAVGFTEPALPCPAPPGGWALGEGTDDWMALNRLTEHVRSHGDRFTDLWQAHPDGPPKPDNSYSPTRSVYVIGTTGDLAQAQAELRAIYPGNLCVHAVAHTAADLDAIAERLRSLNSVTVDAQADPVAVGVRVRVAVLDRVTLERLNLVAGDALLLDEPLLTRLG